MPKGPEKDPHQTYVSDTTDVGSDIRNISNILQILDSHVVKTNPFGANVTGENSYRRAERISAALHIITIHVPDSEPLRHIIRERGIQLLPIILDLRAAFRTPASEKTQHALVSIRELVTLVRLLAVSGYVSAENVTALAEALDELGNLIVVSQRSTLSEQLTVTRDDLIPPLPQSASIRTDIGHSASRRKIERVTVMKDTRAKSVSFIAEARAERIMDILRVGGTLGIKDIASNLPQYSEKMIQRELADLVEGQRVIKTGDKRWSRYRIATS